MIRSFAGVFGSEAETLADAAREALRANGRQAAIALRSPGIALARSGDDALQTSVLLAGRIQNLRALAAELGSDPGLDVDRLVELGFSRWRDGLLSRLRGTYVLAAWDPVTRTGLLAVDQLGAGGLFLHESAGRLWFATELRDLARLLPRRPAPDHRAVVQWLVDGWLSLGETLFEGVRRLEGGHLVRLEGERWEIARYWEPRYAPPRRLDISEAVSEIQGELTRSVRERVSETGATGVLLSGGLDSSTVAAVARGLGSEVELRAYSLVYPGRPEMDESGLIDLLAVELDLPVVRLPVANESVLAAGLAYQEQWELPAPTPMFAFSQPLLHRARADGVGAMLDGEGGDELFGCSEYLVADYVLRANIRGAVALARRIPEGGDAPSWGVTLARVADLGLKGAAPHASHRLLRRALERRYAPVWLRDPEARLYVGSRDLWAWKRLHGPRWWAFLADVLTSLRQQLGAHDFFRHRNALTGVEGRHPLFDDLGLVELVLQVPPELSFDAELTRPLVRAAMADSVPDAVRLRTAKPEFSQLVVDSVAGPDFALVSRLLRARDAEIRRYTRAEKVERLLGARTELRHIAWARLLWRLVTVESWLRAQSDPGFPRALLERSRAVSGD